MKKMDVKLIEIEKTKSPRDIGSTMRSSRMEKAVR